MNKQESGFDVLGPSLAERVMVGRARREGVHGKRIFLYRLQFSPKFVLSIHYWLNFYLLVKVGN